MFVCRWQKGDSTMLIDFIIQLIIAIIIEILKYLGGF